MPNAAGRLLWWAVGLPRWSSPKGLLARGMKVHYLLRGDRYWSNVLDAQESRIVEARLQEEGVTLHHHAEVIEVTGRNGRVNEVRLLNGQTLKCDLLAYAIGIRPRVDAGETGRAGDRSWHPGQ